MNTAWDTSAPVAWILCEDERLGRFFEIELAHLGLASEEPSPLRPPVLVIADTDAHPVEALWQGELPPDCPLLAFGYEPAEVPEERGVYLRRPFPLRTLEVALRRLSAVSVADVTASASPLGHTRAAPPSDRVPSVSPPADGAVRLDAAAMAVSVGEFRVTLTPAEWDILSYLCDRRDRDVSREELSSLLGGESNGVEVYICRLRRKLEKPLGRRLIGTVRGMGYRFIGSVAPHDV